MCEIGPRLLRPRKRNGSVVDFEVEERVSPRRAALRPVDTNITCTGRRERQILRAPSTIRCRPDVGPGVGVVRNLNLKSAGVSRFPIENHPAYGFSRPQIDVYPLGIDSQNARPAGVQVSIYRFGGIFVGAFNRRRERWLTERQVDVRSSCQCRLVRLIAVRRRLRA